MTSPTANTIWSRSFALLCLAELAGYAHNALLTPTIPLYVTHQGGSEFVVGLVLAAFAVTSFVLRPLSGYLADNWSEGGILGWGCFLMGASLLLFMIPAPAATLIGNGLRGIGWAALNTGGYALLVSIAPTTRRGEASGYYSSAQGGTSILFPAVALWLLDAPFGGFAAVVFFSGALAVGGGVIGLVLGVPADSPARDRPASEPGIGWLNPFALVEREVLLPSAVLLCLSLSYPAVSGFLVLYAEAIGIEHIAWYFVACGVTNILARPALGRLADRIGGGPSLAAGFTLEAAGLLLLAASSGLALVIVAGVLYTMGSAMGLATTLALAIQRALPERRGRAMATFSIAYPLSAAIGSLVIGGVVEVAGYFWMFISSAGFGVAGLVLTLITWSSLEAD